MQNIYKPEMSVKGEGKAIGSKTSQVVTLLLPPCALPDCQTTLKVSRVQRRLATGIHVQFNRLMATLGSLCVVSMQGTCMCVHTRRKS